MASFVKKNLSLINFLFLLITILPLFTFADTYINYQGEHSNYGDHAKIRQHVKNHLKDTPGLETLSENDELYYLFSIHDVNHDGYLDGHELREAFADNEIGEGHSQLKLEDIIKMIDHVLLEDDMNNDGKVSWEEYLLSQTYHQK